MRGFIAELKRRNVTRVGGLYVAGAWLLVQVAGTVLPLFDAAPWIGRVLVIVLVIGFVPVLVAAWVLQWTPQGLRRDAGADSGQTTTPQLGKRMDRLIMLVLALALGYFAVDKFVLAPQRQQAQLQQARQEGRSEAVVAAYGDHSIAVLPFRDMSRARDQGYFSEGIAEQVLNLLTRVEGLRVTSRASAFSFTDKQVDIRTIARKLNVVYVLDGSVQTAGDQVRVAVQLIDGRSDTQLWAQTFDRPLKDIFAIQDEIAAAVVDNLKVEVMGATPTSRKTSPAALRLYLQALAAYRKRSPTSLREADDLAAQALELDAAYVDALVLQASIHIDQAGLALIPPAEGFARAGASARRALELDPRSSAAYSKLAYIALSTSGDLAAAASFLQRALEISPSDPSSLRGAEILAAALGRLDLAERIQRFQLARDPLMATSHDALCQTFIQNARYDEAIAECRVALSLEPERAISHFRICLALLFKGDAQAALEEAGKEPFDAFRWFGEAMAYHSLGDRAKSDAVLARIVEAYASEAAYNIAYVEAWRGNTDAAFDWLDKAVEYKDTGLPMIAADPILKRLAGDPRWLPFLRSQNRAPEQLAAIPFSVRLPAPEAE